MQSVLVAAALRVGWGKPAARRGRAGARNRPGLLSADAGSATLKEGRPGARAQYGP